MREREKYWPKCQFGWSAGPIFCDQPARARDQRPAGSAPLVSGLFLKTDNGTERVQLTDLLFVEGYGNFVKCHLASGRILLTADTLKHLENQLPAAEFVRIHKSYLVNVAHIERLYGNCLRVGRRELPIGSTYRQDVLRRLKGA